jgi:hypothetical protein
MTDTDPGAREAADAREPVAEPDATEKATEDLTGRVARWVALTVSRTREEAEDVWAEAQELRRRW